MLRPRGIPFLFILVVLACVRLEACNTPVFRYALERWNPDSYTGAILHRGGLSAAQQKLLERLQGQGEHIQPANFSVCELDLAKPADSYADFLKSLPAEIREKAPSVAGASGSPNQKRRRGK